MDEAQASKFLGFLFDRTHKYDELIKACKP